METWELAAREAVRHTIASYNVAGDRGRLDELAAAFTPEGSLRIGDEPAVIGRRAIVEHLGRSISFDAVPRFVHHHVSGLHFTSVTRAAIEATSYFQVLTDAGLDHWGRYRDRFVPDGDAWLIAERQVFADAFAAGSCFKR